jgi:imidazole glycerol-phosphate synthase subunit HisF
MFRPRIIPVLLLRNLGLVKSVAFRRHRYIGDPINAVRIFNDLLADELVFLDIDATREKRLINLDFVHDVGEEANMPFAVGGGIRTLEDIRTILAKGAEKVVIGSSAFHKPDFITEASKEFGSSTISVCMDVKRSFLKGKRVFVGNANHNTHYTPEGYAKMMEDMGAGEIIVQSVDRDGIMKGYDIELIRNVSEKVSIPVVALGGASGTSDFSDAWHKGYATGLAAASMFVYQGPLNGVLINYPEQRELKELFKT